MREEECWISGSMLYFHSEHLPCELCPAPEGSIHCLAESQHVFIVTLPEGRQAWDTVRVELTGIKKTWGPLGRKHQSRPHLTNTVGLVSK